MVWPSGTCSRGKGNCGSQLSAKNIRVFSSNKYFYWRSVKQIAKSSDLWGLKKKISNDGVTVRYKARFVDFGDTYDPVALGSTLRIALVMAVSRGYETCQREVKTACSQSKVEAGIYVEQPECFVKQRGGNRKVTCHLHKLCTVFDNILAGEMGQSTCGW